MVETCAISFIFCTLQHSIELYDLNIFYFHPLQYFARREWSVAPLIFNIKERGSDCLILYSSVEIELRLRQTIRSLYIIMQHGIFR